MNRSALAAAAVALTVGSTNFAAADVRTSEKTLVRFEGGLGKVVNFFGGKGTKEGVVQTVAVFGDRKATFNESTGTIVDLREEKVYHLDVKKKRYSVVTFAEMRRQIEEARKKAEADAKAANAQRQEAAPPDTSARQMEVDVEVKETGQRKVINGFDTKQVMLTVAIREKGRTLEQSGGLVLSSDVWLTAPVAAMRELTEFELRYARQLQGPEAFGASVEQVQAALAAHPHLKDGLARLADESRKMEGTAILTTTTVDVVKSAEQMASEQQRTTNREEEKSTPPASVTGLIGGFGRRMAQRKADNKEPEPASQPRASMMTTTNERLSIVSDVSAGDVAVPEGFREER